VTNYSTITVRKVATDLREKHRLAATSVNGYLPGQLAACVGTLCDARIISLAANYIVGIALLKQLQARLTARGGLCVSGWSQQHHQR
jgi:hypothetical protein